MQNTAVPGTTQKEAKLTDSRLTSSNSCQTSTETEWRPPVLTDESTRRIRSSSLGQLQKILITLTATWLVSSSFCSAQPVRIISHAYRSSSPASHSGTGGVSPIVAQSLDSTGLGTSPSRNQQPHIAITPFQTNAFASNKDLSVGKSTTPAPWVTHYIQPQQHERQPASSSQQHQRQVGGFRQRPDLLQTTFGSQQGGFGQQQQQPHVLHTSLNSNAGTLQQQQQHQQQLQQLLQSSYGNQQLGSLQQSPHLLQSSPINNQQLFSQQQEQQQQQQQQQQQHQLFGGSTLLQPSAGLGWTPSFAPGNGFPQQGTSFNNNAGAQQSQQFPPQQQQLGFSQQPQQAASLQQQQQLLQLLQAQQQNYRQQQLLGLSASQGGLGSGLPLTQQATFNPFQLTQSAGLNSLVNPLLLRGGYPSRRHQKLDDE